MKIIIVGSGNVATHLSLELFRLKHTIVQVLSRTMDGAKALAKRVDSQAITDPKHLSSNADLIILAVPDDVIQSQYSISFDSDIPVVHTSGSVPMSTLKEHSSYGVFYPLQTFSTDREVDFSTIPICVEASSDHLKNMLLNLGRSLSNNVQELDSEKRKQMHLAAVFVCNFTNHLYAIGKELLDEQGVDYNVLKPLIIETAQKAVDNNPENVQTGPAIRKDARVINRHIEMLDGKSQHQELYELLTNMIFDKHKKYEEL